MSQIDRIKAIATRVCILVTIAAVQLILLELAAFAVIRYLASVPNTFSLASGVYDGKEWAENHWYEMNLAGRVEYHAYVVWRRKPFSGETIRVDSEGLRRTSPSYCSPGAYTIFMFGGSTLWGSGTRDEDTIPSQLARFYEGDGRRVCVINFGESAWVSTQQVIKLLLELKRNNRNPNLVVFYDGANDTSVSIQSGPLDVHGNFAAIRQQFEEASAFRSGTFAYLLKTNIADLLRRLAIKVGMSNPSAQRFRHDSGDIDAMARHVVSNFLKNIEIVETLAEKYRFDYAFFWQPVLFVSQKPLTAVEMELLEAQRSAFPGLELLYQTTYQLVQTQHRPNLHYIADVFDESSETIYIDSAHVSTQGNRLVAQRIYRILKDRGL